MRLYHVSPRCNDASIRAQGIMRARHRCTENVIWLVTRQLIGWDLEHMADRHGTHELSIWIVSIPQSWVMRRGHGPYVCHRDILPERIKGRLIVTADGTLHA